MFIFFTREEHATNSSGIATCYKHCNQLAVITISNIASTYVLNHDEFCIIYYGIKTVLTF